MNNIVEGSERTDVQVGKPTKLSDTALVLLRHGAGQSDGMLLPAPAAVRARGKALELVLTSLVKAGLAEEIAVADGQAIWRRGDDGSALGLRVKANGLAAVGIEAPVIGSMEPPTLSVIERAAADNDTDDHDGDVDAVGLENSSRVDGGAVSSPVQIDSTARRVKKKDQLVLLLSAPDGASMGALSTALGWQGHTVRAALTRLRQAGHALTRAKKDDGTVVYQITPPPSSGLNNSDGPAREGGDDLDKESSTAAIPSAEPVESEASM